MVPREESAAFARFLAHYRHCQVLTCHSPSSEAAKAATLHDQQQVILHIMERLGWTTKSPVDTTQALGYHSSHNANGPGLLKTDRAQATPLTKKE